MIDENDEDNQIIPWRAMLSNSPVIALIFTQVRRNLNFVHKIFFLHFYYCNILTVSTRLGLLCYRELFTKVFT